jgi:hypothetical protein
VLYLKVVNLAVLLCIVLALKPPPMYPLSWFLAIVLEVNVSLMSAGVAIVCQFYCVFISTLLYPANSSF